MRVFLITLLFVLPSCAFSQIPNYFFYDFDQSQEFGAENMISLQKVFSQRMDTLLPARIFKENTTVRKGFGAGYRLLKVGLFDFQLDYLIMLTQHEAFGHGSRWREFGFEGISVNINMAPPFGDGSGFASSGKYNGDNAYTRVESISAIVGGNESNLVLSRSLASRMMFNEEINYRQGLLYLVTKNNLLGYIFVDWLASKEMNRGGDIADYIFSVNNLYGSFGEGYTEDKLLTQSLVSFLNPIQLYSAYSVAKTYILDGETVMKKLPMIQFKKFRYLPALGYNLTPIGSEFILNQYFVGDNRMYQVNFNYGDNTFFDFYGGGIKVFDLINHPKHYLGVNAQFWFQPQLQLESNTPYVNEQEPGVLLKSDYAFYPFGKAHNVGLYTQLGYKSKGYVLGEMLDEGLIFKFGLAIRTQ